MFVTVCYYYLSFPVALNPLQGRIATVNGTIGGSWSIIADGKTVVNNNCTRYNRSFVGLFTLPGNTTNVVIKATNGCFLKDIASFSDGWECFLRDRGSVSLPTRYIAVSVRTYDWWKKFKNTHNITRNARRIWIKNGTVMCNKSFGE